MLSKHCFRRSRAWEHPECCASLVLNQPLANGVHPLHRRGNGHDFDEVRLARDQVRLRLVTLAHAGGLSLLYESRVLDFRVRLGCFNTFSLVQRPPARTSPRDISILSSMQLPGIRLHQPNTTPVRLLIELPAELPAPLSQ